MSPARISSTVASTSDRRRVRRVTESSRRAWRWLGSEERIERSVVSCPHRPSGTSRITSRVGLRPRRSPARRGCGAVSDRTSQGGFEMVVSGRPGSPSLRRGGLDGRRTVRRDLGWAPQRRTGRRDRSVATATQRVGRSTSRLASRAQGRAARSGAVLALDVRRCGRRRSRPRRGLPVLAGLTTRAGTPWGRRTGALCSGPRDLAPLVVDRPAPSARFVLGRVHGRLRRDGRPKRGADGTRPGWRGAVIGVRWP